MLKKRNKSEYVVSSYNARMEIFETIINNKNYIVFERRILPSERDYRLFILKYIVDVHPEIRFPEMGERIIIIDIKNKIKYISKIDDSTQTPPRIIGGLVPLFKKYSPIEFSIIDEMNDRIRIYLERENINNEIMVEFVKVSQKQKEDKEERFADYNEYREKIRQSGFEYIQKIRRPIKEKNYNEYRRKIKQIGSKSDILKLTNVDILNSVLDKDLDLDSYATLRLVNILQGKVPKIKSIIPDVLIADYKSTEYFEYLGKIYATYDQHHLLKKYIRNKKEEILDIIKRQDELKEPASYETTPFFEQKISRAKKITEELLEIVQELEDIQKDKESLSNQVNDLQKDKESLSNQVNDLQKDKESLSNQVNALRYNYTIIMQLLSRIQFHLNRQAIYYGTATK